MTDWFTPCCEALQYGQDEVSFIPQQKIACLIFACSALRGLAVIYPCLVEA